VRRAPACAPGRRTDLLIVLGHGFTGAASEPAAATPDLIDCIGRWLLDTLPPSRQP